MSELLINDAGKTEEMAQIEKVVQNIGWLDSSKDSTIKPDSTFKPKNEGFAIRY
ncbi:hypothetical protein GALMADRAFT_148928 [Galerina marginata CBS 339.88]|uniref:Uncharacterized protein n=1 Tax=Galerina marginata (strain CBS 339.88) TaxID=685588 RepID=A0A067S300_GALM3|nr:hypothetical protein GALMADRAFT_148928 [Galerina marginata CBS 339.88]